MEQHEICHIVCNVIETINEEFEWCKGAVSNPIMIWGILLCIPTLPSVLDFQGLCVGWETFHTTWQWSLNFGNKFGCHDGSRETMRHIPMTPRHLKNPKPLFTSSQTPHQPTYSSPVFLREGRKKTFRYIDFCDNFMKLRESSAQVSSSLTDCWGLWEIWWLTRRSTY